MRIIASHHPYITCPLLPQKLLGPTWGPDPGAALLSGGARVVSFDDYKRTQGWA